jgi:hypothetical protein
MCSHHLIDSVKPQGGKRQVESPIGLVRERFFAHPYPERSDRTVREVFEQERPQPIAAASTDSPPCRPRCRRPAWCRSTTTSTRSAPARSVGQSRSKPMPIGSSFPRKDASSPSIPAASQTDDVAQLVDELEVDGSLELPDPMRSEPMRAPDALHGTDADASRRAGSSASFRKAAAPWSA